MTVLASNVGMMTHVFDIAIGDAVRIDGDPQHCIVTAILIRDRGCQFEVSWMNCGEPKSAWIEPWRVTDVGPDEGKIGI